MALPLAVMRPSDGGKAPLGQRSALSLWTSDSGLGWE